MKKLLLIFLPVFLSLSIIAQKEESLDVKVKSPKMTDLIEKLWVDLPTDCVSVPTSVTVDKGDESCASFTLKHFRQTINRCKLTDAFIEAIKLEFKLLKLIPVGKVAGTILDIADLTSKALSASSPEDLATDLAKYGFGKVVADQVVDKLKKLTDVPEGEAGDVLGNLTKLFYKQLWDKAKAAILPKGEKYDCQPKGDACKSNINMSIEPYTGYDAKVIAKFVFSANGDCNCQLECAGQHLKDWSLHGEMLIVVDKAEVVEEGLIRKSKVLQITLKAEKPSYHVQANCDCSHTSNMTSPTNPNSFFVGLGLINEDAGGNRFNTYGANAAYTYMTSPKLGIMGDAGLYFGRNNSVDYTKLQVLAGISFVPPMQNGKIMLAPHALAGISNIHSKYSNGTYSFSSATTSFAAAIGTDIMTRLNEKIEIGVRLDYNPAFAKGGVSHNFRLSGGVSLRSKKK